MLSMRRLHSDLLAGQSRELLALDFVRAGAGLQTRPHRILKQESAVELRAKEGKRASTNRESVMLRLHHLLDLRKISLLVVYEH